MKSVKNSLTADLAFLSIVVLSFAGTMFLSINSANIAQNSIMLCVTSVILILTYSTNIIVGLIINAAVDFLFLAYTLFSAAHTGVPVSINTYFWILWMPLITTAVSIYCHQPQKLQIENNLLHTQLQKLSTVDDLTELRNMRGFENDALTYMKISKRYNMSLVLMLWKFRFPKELEALIGKDAITTAVKSVSEAIRQELRTEDTAYLLDDNPCLWGTLLFTNPEMTQIMIERVRQRVEHIDLSIFTKQPVPLDLLVAAAEYKGEMITPFNFLAQVKAELIQNADTLLKRRY